ncbi:transcriptional repressor LexA [Psychromonas sp. 14N.309.X.WAT.B.A12]|jgi:repressor LexA|uniref:transcriptional repressor LexA n=1 Tax=unclassified Psychromonas TaxID=2614957 RepID=UPI0025B1B617|nr:transcriptional repressor LexA [Psychromonas sp. 14N.309.X.WAT.B.A12]MDN2664449.1 transcriptional repressor LexA [Psychromonas sp. 14N.309.X.WAT.B.A12]
MKELTKRQGEVLDVIKDQIAKTGMPPTRVELAKILGFKSANAAEEHLKALARKGAIEILSGTSRGIRVVTEHKDNEVAVEGLPLIGKVAAGEPILAQEHVETHYDVDPTLFHPAADFLLRVQGESMKDIGIMDGDLLAVHKTQNINNGQVVVARVEEDVTVKRFYRDGKQVTLKAENNLFDPIKVDLEYQSFDIEGIAVGVIRTADWM